MSKQSYQTFFNVTFFVAVFFISLSFFPKHAHAETTIPLSVELMCSSQDPFITVYFDAIVEDDGYITGNGVYTHPTNGKSMHLVFSGSWDRQEKYIHADIKRYYNDVNNSLTQLVRTNSFEGKFDKTTPLHSSIENDPSIDCTSYIRISVQQEDTSPATSVSDDDLYTPCHTYTALNPPSFSDFSPPYNVFSGNKENIIKARCNKNTAKIIFGDGSEDTYIWNTANITDPQTGKWIPLSLTGDKMINEEWIIGSTEVTQKLSEKQMKDGTFVSAYICHYADDEWKCGCSGNGKCSGKWQIQEIKISDNSPTKQTLSLNISIDNRLGSGSVLVNPGNRKCSSSCNILIPEGENVTIQAVADSGSFFNNWSKKPFSCEKNSSRCNFIMNYDIDIRPYLLKKLHATLLLHGLNSDESVWDNLVHKHFDDVCPTLLLTGDSVVIDTNSYPNNYSVECYRLKFGFFDGLTKGLESIKCKYESGCLGDYSSFDHLGEEVRKAVSFISERYAESYNGDNFNENTEIVLLGYSRGGLAARAFLDDEKEEINNIKALITTATPHKGSPIGRIYKRLEKCLHKDGERKSKNGCEDDWEAADEILSESNLDARFPSIKYLSDKSSQIINLNNSINKLPDIEYRSLTYSGVDLGILSRGIRDDYAICVLNNLYSIFQLNIKCGQSISSQAKKYILGENNPSFYIGDGLVPLASQSIHLVPEWPGYSHVETHFFNDNEDSFVLHYPDVVDENHVGDIESVLIEIYETLGWYSP